MRRQILRHLVKNGREQNTHWTLIPGIVPYESMHPVIMVRKLTLTNDNAKTSPL